MKNEYIRRWLLFGGGGRQVWGGWPMVQQDPRRAVLNGTRLRVLLAALCLLAAIGCRGRGGGGGGDDDDDDDGLDPVAECEGFVVDVATQGEACGGDYDAIERALSDTLECDRVVSIRDEEDWLDCREWADELPCDWDGETLPSACQGQLQKPAE